MPGLPVVPVVTLMEELCDEVPAESLAATVKLYVVEGDKPVAQPD